MLTLILKGIQLRKEVASRLVRNEEGQALIEYALLAFLIAIAAILFLVAIGVDLTEVFDEVEGNLGMNDDGAEAPVSPGDNDTVGPRG